jgi:hypothetical protein
MQICISCRVNGRMRDLRMLGSKLQVCSLVRTPSDRHRLTRTIGALSCRHDRAKQAHQQDQGDGAERAPVASRRGDCHVSPADVVWLAYLQAREQASRPCIGNRLCHRSGRMDGRWPHAQSSHQGGAASNLTAKPPCPVPPVRAPLAPLRLCAAFAQHGHHVRGLLTSCRSLKRG